MQTQTKFRYYTPEEYLALEEKADYKSEYRDGEIVPMTGGTTNHNKIVGNFYAYLKFALKRQDYEIYFSDVRLWIPRYRQYTYPDVMIIQGKPIYSGQGTTTVMNPLLIVEVLSPSTQNYDQGDKFMYYRSISEMKEYILIAQNEYYLMQYSKTANGKWLLTEYQGEETSLALKYLDFKIPLSHLYERVNIQESETEE